MNRLHKVVRNQYIPSAVALAMAILFWFVGMFGGLSRLSKSQPPLDTLTWLLFIYASIVLSVALGLWAASDLWRRMSRHRERAPEPRKGRRGAKIDT